MKIFIDFFPLFLFFVAFKLAGIYTATAVAIAASVAQVAWSRFRQGRFEGMHLMQLAIIGVFGGLTLALHNDTFIRWKPTILYWAFAAVFLGSQIIGRRTAAEHLLDRQVSMPARIWKIYNLSWGVFFLLMGALNLYFAFFYGLQESKAARLDTWVTMKVWGSLALTVVFAVAQALFLSKHLEQPQAEIATQKEEQ
ncbi:MAG: septation protein A [Gammaproteobacteria bacterium]|nr:septation protein A [Gammaproteobacteria bacterium]